MSKPNFEAEQSVLGAVLVRPEILSDVATTLSPESFYRAAHGKVFQAMLDLQERGEPVDLVTLTKLLRERGQLDALGGPVFLAELSEQVGFATNAVHYARMVQNKYRVRRLSARAREISAACEKFEDKNGKVADLYFFAESLLQDSFQEVDFQRPELVSAPQLLAKDFGQNTPIFGSGLLVEGGSLIIAGESGDGKSMTRLEMALYLAIGRDIWGLEVPRARRVLIIQFENTEQLEQIRLKRMLLGLRVDCPAGLIFSSPLSRFDLGEKLDRARLVTTIQQSQAEVVFFDPLSSLHQVDENSNSLMRRVLDNLTEINRLTGTTAIVIHHYGKPPKEETSGLYRTRGASSIRDWCDTLIGYSRKKSDDLILRQLEFLKVRHGPEPKPLLLARDKDTFLQAVTEGGAVCSPARVAAILESFGGQAGWTDLVRAIQSAVGCQERRAREFLKGAILQGYVREANDSNDSRKKIYKAVQ